MLSKLRTLSPAMSAGSPDMDRSALKQFRLEDADTSPILKTYRKWLKTTRVDQRDALYRKLLADVRSGAAHPESLLVFVTSEVNHRLAFWATRAYLRHQICDISDELAGLNQVARLIDRGQTLNPGAVLAGIVSMSDHRALAVARLLRRNMKAADIKAYSRVQDGQLRAASIDFAVEWMLELDPIADQPSIRDLGCGLMVAINHDRAGWVEVLPAAEPIAFKSTAPAGMVRFPDFIRDLKPTIRVLRKRLSDAHLMRKMERSFSSHGCAVA